MIGHVAGAPIEELLPLLAGGGTVVAVAARAVLARSLRRGRRRDERTEPGLTSRR